MKKKIFTIILGSLLLVSMLPVGSMASTSTAPANALFYQSFAADTNVAGFSAHSYSSAGTNFALAQDPADETNYALLVPNLVIGSANNNTATPIRIPQMNGLDNLTVVDDFVKISFKVKVVGTSTDPVPIPFYANSASFPVSTSASYYYLDANISIPADKLNTWVDVEIITHANAKTEKYEFRRSAGFDYYLDDICVVPVEKSYVSDMKIIGHEYRSKVGKTAETLDKTYILRYCVGTQGGTYGKSETVSPFVFLLPDATDYNALVVTAVYKNDTNYRTLVDIKPVSVPVTSTSLPVSPALTDLAFDLSGAGLTDGTYEVQTFVWNLAGLAPLANVATNPVQ